MRYLYIVIGILATSCNSERIYIGDVDKLISNQLENNQFEIERIRKEIKDWKIEGRTRNVSLLSKLDSVHEKVLSLVDSMDRYDRLTALRQSKEFIEKRFGKIDSSDEIPLEINEETPPSLIKLHITKLESLFIRDHRYQYDYGNTQVRIRFDHITVQVLPDKTLVKNGETVSGRIMVIGETKFEDVKDIIKRVTMNGQEVHVDKDGWNFQVKPTVKEHGIVRYELKSEAMLNDSVTFKGQHIIYVQN